MGAVGPVLPTLRTKDQRARRSCARCRCKWVGVDGQRAHGRVGGNGVAHREGGGDIVGGPREVQSYLAMFQRDPQSASEWQSFFDDEDDHLAELQRLNDRWSDVLDVSDSSHADDVREYRDAGVWLSHQKEQATMGRACWYSPSISHAKSIPLRHPVRARKCSEPACRRGSVPGVTLTCADAVKPALTRTFDVRSLRLDTGQYAGNAD